MEFEGRRAVDASLAGKCARGVSAVRANVVGECGAVVARVIRVSFCFIFLALGESPYVCLRCPYASVRDMLVERVTLSFRWSLGGGKLSEAR